TGDTTQTIDVTAPGNYAVTVINSFGCSSTDTVLVTPGGSITNNQANISMCQGLTATLDAGNPGNSFLWSTGAVTQTITVSSSGQYAVTITNLNGCTATLISTVQVNPLPSAAITINDACINQAIQFFDSSSISAGNISNWQWSFGDSALSNVQNPTHNFANAGTYNISLVVTSAAGCMDSISQSITIFPKPVVAFSGVNACPGSAIQFQNISSVATGSINAYHWNFGDGTTSSVLTPTHTYTSSGNYQVALTVNSSGGCVDSLIQQVTIYPKPVAQFTAPAVCLNQQTNFNNQSTVNGNNINAWSWNFGNGNVSNVQSPAITYMSPGVYNVQLIVQTAYLCSDTIVKPITIHALPIADAGVNQSVCLGNQVVLTASGGSTYNWTPVVSNSNVLTITPLTTQAYYVHVTDSNNCAATDSVVVTVLLPPVADAGVDKSICKGSSTTLTATGGGSYIWMPTSQTSSAVTVSPANNTMYAVVVTAPNGCTATDSVLVTVNPLPMASAGPNRNICENQVISFSASGGVSYLWYPTGDTTATIMVNPATTSAYIVEVTDINGCKAMDTMIVTVFPRPIVNLTDTFVCIGYNATLDAGNAGSIFQWIPNGETTQTIQVSTAGSYGVIVTAPNGCTTYDDAIVTVSDSLINSAVNVAICSGQTTTLNAGNAGSTYLWSTGATTASITVASQGTYTVTVTGTDGCSAIFNNQVNVNPLPLLQFTASPLCFGSPTQFVNQSSITSGNINSFYWSFGDGMTDTSANTSYQYPLAGTYAVSLIATSTSGCVDSLTQQVTVHDIPDAKFAANNVCKNIQTTFNDQSSVANGIIVAWDWDFGDGASSQSKNPLHTYA
ncbi:MAG TPA: PKD domain-containing protein, partial [Bacteroidia bacterium]|nr:PKD domain-containing protein [Bacteroidia bacterium]